MKIAHVVENLERGGLERMVIDLAHAQKAAGHDVQVACLFQSGALAAELERSGIGVVACGKRSGFDLAAISRLRVWLRARAGGVLHTHNAGAHYHAVLAATGIGFRRIINTRHSMSAPDHRHRRERLYRCAMPRTDLVATVCDAARVRCAGQGVSPRGGVRAVPNGIRVETIAPTSAAARAALASTLELGDGARIVGTVGRLNPIKDQSNLVRAFAAVQVALPTAALVVAGDGAMLGELRSLAESLGLSSRVRFLGDRGDVQRLLSGFEVFALSSRTEGYSIALLEACTAGLPIVATDVGGNREIVAHGRNGLLVPPQDPDALAAALQAVLGKPAHAQAMGDAGRAWALREATLDAMAARYERLYAGA